MEIRLAKRDLEAALSVVSSAVSSSGTDITHHYVFRTVPAPAEGGLATVEVLASSGTVFASCPVVCEVTSEGAFTVESKRLKQWLGAVGDEPLGFRHAAGEVTATASRGEAVFQSLDPTTFPYWDELLAGIVETATIPAKRLYEALAYVRPFISPDDTKSPSMSITESREGQLMATNKIIAAMVKVKGLEASNLRVAGKDLGPLLGFLTKQGDTPVSVLEHDRALILRAASGAVFGETRSQAVFPDLRRDSTLVPDHWWELLVEDVSTGIQFVQAAADPQSTAVTFSQGQGFVLLSMPRQNSTKRTELRIPCSEMGTKESALPLPDGGFKVNQPALSKMLSSWSGDKIRFQLFVHRRGGYLHTEEVRGGEEGDQYLTILTFQR